MAEIRCSLEIRHLVDDHVRRGRDDSCADGRAVEAVGDRRLGAERGDDACFLPPAGEAYDPMAGGHEQGNQAPAKGAGGSCNKDAHVATSRGTALPSAMTNSFGRGRNQGCQPQPLLEAAEQNCGDRSSLLYCLKAVRFMALMLTALALVPAGTHLLALPNKIGLPRIGISSSKGSIAAGHSWARY
jgi:hypothetical protein